MSFVSTLLHGLNEEVKKMVETAVLELRNELVLDGPEVTKSAFGLSAEFATTLNRLNESDKMNSKSIIDIVKDMISHRHDIAKCRDDIAFIKQSMLTEDNYKELKGDIKLHTNCIEELRKYKNAHSDSLTHHSALMAELQQKVTAAVDTISLKAADLDELSDKVNSELVTQEAKIKRLEDGGVSAFFEKRIKHLEDLLECNIQVRLGRVEPRVKSLEESESNGSVSAVLKRIEVLECDFRNMGEMKDRIRVLEETLARMVTWASSLHNWSDK